MSCKLVSVLTRKKTEEQSTEGGKLARVLTLVDLTALGIGSTLGLGVYVLAGAVAKSQAGPAVCLSFLVAAVASAVAGKLIFLIEHVTGIYRFHIDYYYFRLSNLRR